MCHYTLTALISALFISTVMFQKVIHQKCRGGTYPFSNIKRSIFPDDKVPWSQPFQDYSPPEYNSPSLHNKPWADPDLSDPNFKPKWNSLDGTVNRASHTGPYELINGRPLNPVGRTGLSGRGILGKWGPNHAADPIVTRWKVIDNIKQVHSESKLPILQFCAIQRRDCSQWAIPGGMVDPGERVSETLKREFLEEALNSLERDAERARKDEEMIGSFFKSAGREVYRGYVDDPRNTDNAWMETVAVNFHDEPGDSVGKFELQAGDDAKGVHWMDVAGSLDLYASHGKFLEEVAKTRGAHW